MRVIYSGDSRLHSLSLNLDLFLFYYFHVHAAAAALEPMSETCVVRVVCPLTDEMTPHTFPKEKKSFLIFLFGALNIMAHPLSPAGVFSFLSLNSSDNMAVRRLQKALFPSIGNLYIYNKYIERGGGEGSPVDSSKQQRHTKTRTVLSVCCLCCCWPALL